MKTQEKSHSAIQRTMEGFISSPVVKSFLAGSFSGTCSTVLFQPLDLVKTRLQSPVAIGQAPSGIASIVTNVIRTEKLIGLWRGMVPSISRTVPGVGMYFSALHWLKSSVGSSDPHPFESMCLGAFARCISGVSMLPFTVVKCRYESGYFPYRSVIGAIRLIYTTEGVKGLYSGLSATLLRDAPFSGLYLMFYTQLKKGYRKCSGYDSVNPAIHFSCGITAGTFASIVTQPADVVKTHMQLYPDKYETAWKACQHVYQNEGLQGYLRGIVPRCVRRSLMAAMAWTVYEQIMSSFLK